MNEQSQEVARCGHMQLLSATAKSSATSTATKTEQNHPKAASIRELRAQLRAQQGRNPSATEMDSVAPAVAPNVSPRPGSCAVALPSQRNDATGLEQWQLDLVREFMEVDGLTLDQARALVAVAVQPRAPADWLALIAELDCLIGRYCDHHRLTPEARMHIMAMRTKQSLASIPAALEWFTAQLAGGSDERA